MTTDRRQQILRLYHQALAREASERMVFLTEACAGDDDLRCDVESLLAHDPPEDFLAVGGILIGQQIGAYRVDSQLGSGGMSDVYRATDTTLGRSVAIKVLPPLFAHDPERRARLEREAKALAAFNHPHIAQVYGLEATGGGVSALVMELVNGETLAEVLKKGRLPIDDALRYGAQIADALAAAHSHGVVHRDVKSTNVMISDGVVKVLDFGLAKLSGATNSGAETALPGGEGLTHPHEVLGTMAYMSPEQAEGKPVDARSDVFSLGVVLYEMLCGQRPFSGDTAIAALAAMLKSAPPRPRIVRREIPVTVERIVLRCLEKKPDARFSSAREVHQALNGYIESRSSSGISRRAALVGATAVVLVSIVGVGVRSYVQTARLRWVAHEAIPEATRLIIENRRLAAATLYRTIEQYPPASRALFALADAVAAEPIPVVSTPAGARVYISDYVAAAGDDLSEWQFLGEAPLTVNGIPRWGYYRIRAIKEGFAPVEQTHFTGPGLAAKVEVALHPQNDVPLGMVWVPAMDATVPAGMVAPRVTLPGFWIDRYEVTNRLFKAFVDAGGYQKEEYWKEPFVRDGRTLSWREGIDGFRDATNRLGPAGWQLGTYPDGAEELPVGGVSWYEAAAYAAFAGKNLPTLHEWWGVAINPSSSDILSLSNFGSDRPEAVGANRGMARFGAYDMAGNVKEWAANPGRGELRYLLGGAWKEEPYVFTVADPRAPFSREDTFGFRCVRRTTPPPEEAFRSFERPTPPARATPVNDGTFQRFLDLHAYDKTDLDATVDRVDDSSPYWRRETVSFRAAYGNERVIAHLFLPKRSAPPYQIVVLIGSANIHELRRVEDLGGPYQFLLRAGRAVLIPALSGTLERGPSPFILPLNQERERAVRWSKDLGRSLDYLETRPDIDTEKLGLYGVSSGATHAIWMTVVHRRFKTAVIASGGLFRNQPPETDSWNFAPRMRVPVLMLNGHDDFMVPYETNQRVLFEALGTKNKVFTRYEGGHANLLTRPDLIGEVLDWFDKYLGPV